MCAREAARVARFGLAPVSKCLHAGGMRIVDGPTRARDVSFEVEWVGAITQIPAYVTGEDAPFRPDVLVWMMVGGPIVGQSVGKPGELVCDAVASFRNALASPLARRSGAPARVRVASPELATALRDGLSREVEVVTAPTPELDEALASLREHMRVGGDAEPSFLDGGASPDAVASFFRAAARLYRAKPWKVVPADQNVIGVTIPALGIEGGVISIIGQMGQSFGLVYFSSHDDFDAYVDAADAVEQGEDCRVPSHLAINFERAADLPRALRREATKHGWEVAEPSAYPCIAAIDEDLVGVPPTASHVAITEALSLAVAEIVEKDRRALVAALAGGAPLRRVLQVKAHDGVIEVVAVAPAEGGVVRDEIPFGPVADLAALEEAALETGEIDPDARRDVEEELLASFAASPEARGIDDAGDCTLILDYAADYLNCTLASLDARGLREVVFELIPRKVCAEPASAKPVVETMRAFYAFMKRAHGLPQADACLRVLGPDAVAKLEAALSDASTFGMAKTMVMAGEERGFDVRSEAGLAAWIRELQRGRPPVDLLLAGNGGPGRGATRAADAKKKVARKAARKARRKNR